MLLLEREIAIWVSNMCCHAQVLSDHDLLKLVLRSLLLSDLCRSALVCRDWRDVALSNDFWRDVSFEKCSVRPEQVINLRIGNQKDC